MNELSVRHVPFLISITMISLANESSSSICLATITDEGLDANVIIIPTRLLGAISAFPLYNVY